MASKEVEEVKVEEEAKETGEERLSSSKNVTTESASKNDKTDASTEGNNDITNGNNNNNNNSQGKILRVVARMFREHADLFLKQASHLEQLSISPHLINHQQYDQNHPYNDDVGGEIPCRENFLDKIRRESVIDLAKKTYENMRYTKAIVDGLIKSKHTSNRSDRRKFAFEIFEEDIFSQIVKEEEFKKLTREHLKQQAGGQSKNKGNTSSSSSIHDVVGANEYVFKRTQEEWQKLSKKKLREYAMRASGPEGMKHIKKKQMNGVKSRTSKKRNLNPSKDGRKGDDDNDNGNRPGKNEKKNTTPATKKRKVSVKKKDDGNESDDSRGDSSSNSSDSDSNSVSSSVKAANNKSDEASIQNIDDDDDDFDLLAMPPLPIPTTETKTPARRERDESSDSSDDNPGKAASFDESDDDSSSLGIIPH